MSLRTKLTLTHTLVALLAVVVVALVINRVVNISFERLASAQAARTSTQVARLLGVAYERRGSWTDIRILFDTNSQRWPFINQQRLVVADEAGQIVADSLGLLEGQTLTAEQRAAATPIIADGRQVGFLVVVPVSSRIDALGERFLRGVNRSLIVASLLAIALAALIGVFFAQRLTRPLQALTVAARRLATPHGRTADALPVRSTDEVGALTLTFNQLSAELGKQEQLRRQMVADIAHELRTPLSVLQMELESLEDGVVEMSPTALVSLREEVDLLNRLIEDLRLLTLAEAGQLQFSMTMVQPGAILKRVAAIAATRARRQRIALHVDIASNLPTVRADEQRLVQVLNNLVDNALRYTPTNGTITLSCHAPEAAGEIWLSVHDTGPGIPADELGSIFERFYRTDRARLRSTGGSGLGLAIVRGLVQAMGGRVWADSTPGSGTTLTIALPQSNV